MNTRKHLCRPMRLFLLGSVVTCLAVAGLARADIFRWDDGQVIPGTEGITPGPDTQFGARVLQFAELSNTNLAGASFYDYMLHGSDLSGARFTNANLSNTFLTASNLTGADFTGATVIGTYFYGTRGFTKEQLYSTDSYRAKDLHGIGVGFLDLSGWELSGQDLSGAAFSRSTLTNTNLAGAYLTHAYLDGATLTNTNLAGADLTKAHFDRATLINTNLAGADLTSAYFVDGAALINTNLAGADLTNAYLFAATLANTNLSFADLRLATYDSLSGALVRNTILGDGTIDGLKLAAGERLVAYAGVPLAVKITGDVFIAPTAAFDLTDNAAIVSYAGTSTAATVREHIISGRGGPGPGGDWTGPGITSSTAAAANGAQSDLRSLGYADNATLPLGAYTSFHGAAVDKTAVLIAFTRTGDANLDGVVNDDDVTILGATYSPGVPQPSWALGDFDYNGFVDDDDVTLLNAFYDPSAPPLNSPAAPGAGGELHSGVSAVPEPSTVALLTVLAAVLLLTWRYTNKSGRWGECQEEIT